MKKMRNLKWSLQSLLTIILFTQAGCNNGSSPEVPSQSGGASNTSTGRVNVISLPANYGNRGVASDRKYISGRKKSQADIMRNWITHRYGNKASTNSKNKSAVVSIPVYGINTSINAPADNSCFTGQLTVNPNSMQSQISSQTLSSIISTSSQTTLGIGLDSNLMLLDPALSVTNLDLVLASDSQTHLTSSQTVFQFSQTAQLNFNNFITSKLPQTSSASELGQLCGSKVITQTTGYFNAYVEIVVSTDNSNYSNSIAFNNSNSSMETIFGTYSKLVQASSQNVSFSVNIFTQGGTPQDIAAINDAAMEVTGQQCLQGISNSCSQWTSDIENAISLAGQDAISEAQQGNLDYLEISTASPIAQFQNIETATPNKLNVIDPYLTMSSTLEKMGEMSLNLSLLQSKASNLNNLLQQNGLSQLDNTTMLQQLQQGYATASAYINDMMENCLNNPQAVCNGVESTLSSLFTDVSNQNPNTVPPSIIPYLVANFSALQMSGTYNDSYGNSYSYSTAVTPIRPFTSDSLTLMYFECASEWDYSTGNVTADTIASCINTTNNPYNTAGILSVAGTSPIAVQPLVINNNGTPAVTVFNINPYYSNATSSILSNGVGYIFYVNNLDSFESNPIGSYFDNGVIYNGYVNFPGWVVNNEYWTYTQDPLSVSLYPNGYSLTNSSPSCQFSTDTSCNVTLTVPNTNVQTQDSILLQYSPNWPAFVYPN